MPLGYTMFRDPKGNKTDRAEKTHEILGWTAAASGLKKVLREDAGIGCLIRCFTWNCSNNTSFDSGLKASSRMDRIQANEVGTKGI